MMSKSDTSVTARDLPCGCVSLQRSDSEIAEAVRLQRAEDMRFGGSVKLGRYEVIRELGQGGMATAFLAYAPGGQTVVLKTPHLNSADLNDRLRDEARIGIRLAHPALVETLDLFEHDGKPVLVVAFIDGVSVDALRRQGPLPAVAVARIGWQIAQGLHAVHLATDETGRALHMVHRDVTAPNVLLDKSGDARLIDLGIARSVENLAATEPGTIKGTVRYLAPELLQGMPPTAQSDLWGLGCVLFEAATGRPVHEGAPAQTMISILRTHPLDKPEAAGLNPSLRAALANLFEMDPNRRIGDGYEFAEVLQRVEAELGDGEHVLAAAVIEATGHQDEADRAKGQAGASVFHSAPHPAAAGLPALVGTLLGSAPAPTRAPPPRAAAPSAPTTGFPQSGGPPVTPFSPHGIGSGLYSAPAAEAQTSYEIPRSEPRWSPPPPAGFCSPSSEAEAPPRTPLTPSPMSVAPNPFAGSLDLELESRPPKRARLGTSPPARARAATRAPKSAHVVHSKKLFAVALIAIAIGLAWRFAIKPRLKESDEQTAAPALVAPSQPMRLAHAAPAHQAMVVPSMKRGT
jgi:hypothetical protein